MIKYLNTFLITSFLLFISCNILVKSDTEKYFEQTFEFIEKNSIKRNEIDWKQLEKTVRDSIKTLNSNYDVHKAISYTIRLINDGHSIFGAPSSSENRNKSINAKINDKKYQPTIPPIVTKIVANDIGYIKLSGLNILDDSLSRCYTLKIRETLLELDASAKLSGWIIDLTVHGGGALHCESLGLSPLFKSSLIGIFLSNQNTYGKIICTNKSFNFADLNLGSLTYDSTFVNENKKIAVLVGDKTVSSGEFLALAFRFQDNTKLFGKKTRGKTSHCRMLKLKEGAILSLATFDYCDSNGKIIKDGIIPDVECETEESIIKAIEWIKNAL